MLGLTVEEKKASLIFKTKTDLFELIDSYDKYFQRVGSLLLMQRNLAKNVEGATAWYWAFNELKSQRFSKDEFVDGLYAFLGVNGLSIKRNAIEKEYNCFKNTYVSEDRFNRKTIMDEDTYPFFAPLHILRVNDAKVIEKNPANDSEIPLEVLIYSIVYDNTDGVDCEQKQIGLDMLMEEKLQIGKYYCIKYSKLIDLLMEAENRNMLILTNNFGNRYVELTDYPYGDLLKSYYESGER